MFFRKMYVEKDLCVWEKNEIIRPEMLSPPFYRQIKPKFPLPPTFLQGNRSLTASYLVTYYYYYFLLP